MRPSARRSLVLACMVAAAAALGGCLAPGDGEGVGDGDDDRRDGPASSGSAPVRWLAIGDMGTGDEAQAAVAAGMRDVCRQAGCDFVVGLGDNIYEAGAANAYDPQFILKFEQPYAGFGVPFYMTLGNHDNGGVRSLHAAGDVQVQYAAREDRAMDLWVMPARWYEHVHGPVRFLALDTNIVFAQQAEAPGAAQLLSQDVDGVRQMAWLRERLAAKAPGEWTFLHGHHPLFSNGEHGNASLESPSLHRWLEEAVCASGSVDALVTGHDHDLQHLAAKPQLCGRTEFIVSGAAAQVRDVPGEPNAAHFACGSTLGFTWMQADGEVLTTRMHAADGTLLFERVLHRGDPLASTATVHARPATCTP